jgi:hypothetical protein
VPAVLCGRRPTGIVFVLPCIEPRWSPPHGVVCGYGSLPYLQGRRPS